MYLLAVLLINFYTYQLIAIYVDGFYKDVSKKEQNKNVQSMKALTYSC